MIFFSVGGFLCSAQINILDIPLALIAWFLIFIVLAEQNWLNKGTQKVQEEAAKETTGNTHPGREYCILGETTVVLVSVMFNNRLKKFAHYARLSSFVSLCAKKR